MMRTFSVQSALSTFFCICLTLASIFASCPANASMITITLQDTGNISGSLSARQYDSFGNFSGNIGPQGDSSFIQDITYDNITGDLWALITDANTSAATIANLTQNTSFAAGVNVTFDHGANIDVYNGAATITLQDTGNISGSLSARQYDSFGNFSGNIGPQGDSSFIQDITYDNITGDLWALITDANTSAATIANLTQNTSFAAGVNVTFDHGANIDFFSSEGTVPVPVPSTLTLMGLGLAGLGFATWRRRDA